MERGEEGGGGGVPCLLYSGVAEGRVEEDAVPGGEHHHLSHECFHQPEYERRPEPAVEHLSVW